MCLDSTNEDSSTLDMTFSWSHLVLMTEEVLLSRNFSRYLTCSVMGLCVNRTPVVASRHRSAFMSIPKQKSQSNMLSGKVKSRPMCINTENLA